MIEGATSYLCRSASSARCSLRPIPSLALDVVVSLGVYSPCNVRLSRFASRVFSMRYASRCVYYYYHCYSYYHCYCYCYCC